MRSPLFGLVFQPFTHIHNFPERISHVLTKLFYNFLHIDRFSEGEAVYIYLVCRTSENALCCFGIIMKLSGL